MLITEEEVPELKRWITKKLENISDADSEVLADYVLALIRAEVSDFELRTSAIENLDDFLKSYTVAFVDELLQVARLKSYLPAHLRKPTVPAPTTVPPSRTGNSAVGPPRSEQRPGHKRSHSDALGSQQGQEPAKRANGRNIKQATKGPGRLPHTNGLPYGAVHANLAVDGVAGGFPMPFDPSDPVATMMAFQAMGMPMPQMGPNGTFTFPQAAMAGPQRHQGKRKSKKRCKDYDMKGICHRGINCPFVHDSNQIIIPAGARSQSPRNKFAQRANSPNAVRNGASANGKRGNHKRSEFSQGHPSFDRTNTTIVVEQIPDENCNEEAVRSFFSVFGDIQEVTMHQSKHLALVNYQDHDSAQVAYDSPKVIFDNRFVKVYWLNAKAAAQLNQNGTLQGHARPQSSSDTAQEPAVDLEKFAREAEAAQKRWEERKALKEETDTKLADIAKKAAALTEEKRALEAKLREIGGLPPQSDADRQTEALRNQLRALEEEAKSLGIEPAPWGSGSRGRGRGGFRGAPRGRGARGRGSFRGAVAYGAFNLDNRPKKVRVSGAAFDAACDEALRQHLAATVGDYASVEPDAGAADDDGVPQALFVAFNDRPSAEAFYYGLRDVPGVGKLDMEWVREAQAPAKGGEEDGGGDVNNAMEEDDRSVGDREDGEVAQDEEHAAGSEIDYDVADDENRWR